MAKRRTFRKNRPRRRGRKGRLPGTMQIGSPYMVYRKLAYVGTQTTITPGAVGVCVVRVLKLNSLYDPDDSNVFGNKQYRCFDQYCATEESTGLYKHFVVYGNRVTCTFMNLDTSNNQMVGITVRANNTTLNDYVDYREDAHTVSRILGVQGSGSENATLSLNWSAKKFFGKRSLDGIGFQGLYNSDPNQIAYVHIWVSGIGIDTGNVIVVPKMVAICQFSEPLSPAPSS